MRTAKHRLQLYELPPASTYLVEVAGGDVFQFGPFDGETAMSLVEVLFPASRLLRLPYQHCKLDDDAVLVLGSAQLMAELEAPTE